MSETVKNDRKSKVNQLSKFALFDHKKRLPINLLLFLIQISTGLIVGVTGIIALQLNQTFSNLAQAQGLGSLNSATAISFDALLFFGLIISGIIAPFFARKIGVVNLMRISLIQNLAGSLLITIFGFLAQQNAFFSLSAAFVMFGLGKFSLGFAIGFANSAFILIVVENNKKVGKINRYLSLGTAFFGLGAIITSIVGLRVATLIPVEIGPITSFITWQWYYLAISIFLFSILILWLVFKFKEKHKHFYELNRKIIEKHKKLMTKEKNKKTSLILIIFLVILIYVLIYFVINTVNITWSTGMQFQPNSSFGGGLLGPGIGAGFQPITVGIIIAMFYFAQTIGAIIYSIFAHKISELKIVAVSGIVISVSAGLFLINLAPLLNSITIALIFSFGIGILLSTAQNATISYAVKTTKNPRIINIIPSLTFSFAFATGILISLTALLKTSPPNGTGVLGYTIAIVPAGMFIALLIGIIYVVQKKFKLTTTNEKN